MKHFFAIPVFLILLTSFSPIAKAQQPAAPVLRGANVATELTEKDVRDVIEVCEANQLSWAYHAYRENDLWDPERSNFKKSDTTQKKTTPRLELLKEFFDRNESE